MVASWLGLTQAISTNSKCAGIAACHSVLSWCWLTFFLHTWSFFVEFSAENSFSFHLLLILKTTGNQPDIHHHLKAVLLFYYDFNSQLHHIVNFFVWWINLAVKQHKLSTTSYTLLAYIDKMSHLAIVICSSLYCSILSTITFVAWL